MCVHICVCVYIYVCVCVCVKVSSFQYTSMALRWCIYLGLWFGLKLNLFTWNYINQKVKHVLFGDRHGNVTSLERKRQCVCVCVCVCVTCTVLLFDSSVCSQALRESSVTNISTAFDNIRGTSELIIWGRERERERAFRGGGKETFITFTSSSILIIFLIRASGNSGFFQ